MIGAPLTIREKAPATTSDDVLPGSTVHRHHAQPVAVEQRQEGVVGGTVQQGPGERRFQLGAQAAGQIPGAEAVVVGAAEKLARAVVQLQTGVAPRQTLVEFAQLDVQQRSFLSD